MHWFGAAKFQKKLAIRFYELINVSLCSRKEPDFACLVSDEAPRLSQPTTAAPSRESVSVRRRHTLTRHFG
jgi:hypothetical protein